MMPPGVAGPSSGRPLPSRSGCRRGADATTRGRLERRFASEALPLHGELLRTARRYTMNVHDAEDLVQETFVKAWLRYESCTPGSNTRAWMTRIMVNIWIDDYRKARRRPTVVLTGSDADTSFPIEGQRGFTDPSAEETALGQLPNDHLVQGIRSLPALLQSVLFYADVSQLPMRTIAEIEGVPVGTVGSRLHRARHQLRSALLEGVALGHEGVEIPHAANGSTRREHRRVVHGVTCEHHSPA